MSLPLFGAGAGGGGASGLSPAAMMGLMGANVAASAATGAGPNAPVAPPTEEQKEAFIQEYAKYLEGLKVTNPEEYKEIMKEMQAAAREAKVGFEPQMPGGKKMGAQGVTKEEEEEGEMVTPEPGFVIKTLNLTGNKVFINVCQSDHIRGVSKKKQLDADGNEQEGVSIPLSLGPPCPMKLKGGESCVVFDCIVNTAVIKDAEADRTGGYRNFLCDLCIQYIETKYKISLDHKYKLPRAKYKGETMRTQRIRKSHAPVIEELDEDVAPVQEAVAAAQKPAAANKKKQEPLKPTKSRSLKVKAPKEHMQHNVLWVYEGAEEPQPWNPNADDAAVEVVVSVQLDKMPATSSPACDIAEELICIEASGYHALEIPLPVRVAYDSPEASAVLDTAASVLVLRVPVFDASEEEAEPDATKQPDLGSKVWLLQQALRSDDDGTEEHKQPAAPPTAAEAAAAAVKPSPSTRYGLSGGPNVIDVLQEDEELPEDRFHKTDIISQHLLMERAQAKEERKKKQAERDAAEEIEKREQAAADKAAAEAAHAAERKAALASIADEDTGEGDLVLTNDVAFELLD